MKKFILDLQNHSTSEDTCLAGRIDGSLLKDFYNFALLEQHYDQIEVIIPEQLVVVNASYFIGAFGERLSELTPVGFKKKYVFISNNQYSVDRIYNYIDDQYFRLASVFSL